MSAALDILQKLADDDGLLLERRGDVGLLSNGGEHSVAVVLNGPEDLQIELAPARYADAKLRLRMA